MTKIIKPEGSRDFFRVYRLQDKEVQTIKEYRRIINLFFLFFRDKAFTGDFLLLPYKMGYFAIIGSKPKPDLDETGLDRSMKISWGMREKFGILFRCTNERTNGYNFRFKWMRNKYYRKKNPFDCFRFYLSTPNRKMLFNKIFHEGKEYYFKN